MPRIGALGSHPIFRISGSQKVLTWDLHHKGIERRSQYYGPHHLPCLSLATPRQTNRAPLEFCMVAPIFCPMGRWSGDAYHGAGAVIGMGRVNAVGNRIDGDARNHVNR